MNKKYWKWIFLFLIIVAIGLAVHSYFNEGIISSLMNNDMTAALSYLASFGWAAAVIFVLFIILEVVFAPIPPLILYLIGGVMFGTLWGGVLALLGNVVGAALAFWIARTFARGYIERKTNKKLQKKFEKFTQRYGYLAIFLLRVNPITTSDLFSYIAGLSRLKFWGFLAATTLALVPYVFLQSYFGNLFTNNSLLFNLFIVAGIVYVILFVVAIFIFRNKTKKPKKKA